MINVLSNQTKKRLILEAYTYLYQVVDCVKKGVPVPIDEFNLVGGRKSGKSISIQLLYGLLGMLPIKVGLVAFRASKDSSVELLNDFVATFESFDIPHRVNKSKGTIQIGINTIRIYGLNSMSTYGAQKSGLAKISGVNYIFKYFEERFEFDTKQYQALQEAIRGFDNAVQSITINVCNPWSKGSPYIKYCESFQKWNLNTMKTTGNQIDIYETLDKESGIKRTILFHYTNWRIAKSVLSNSEIAEILNTWNIDRNRAMTTDYGMPGYEFGAIYTHLLHKVGKPFYHLEPQYIVAGMDYGWSQRDTGGKTVANFGVANLENGVDIYGEYIHDNARTPKSPNQVAKEIVEFYIKQMELFMHNTGNQVPQKTIVRVDNMAVGIITILNNVAKDYRVNHWLTFVKCRKYPISDRISITLALMGAQWLRIDNIECRNLISEFEMSQYEDTETEKRIKANDHSLNAFEYAVEGVMYKLARNVGLSELANKYIEKESLW